SQDKLSTERKARLDSLGFDWDPHTTRWEEGFEHLHVFAKEHKHCRVPSGYKSPDGYQLGNWVGNQRQSQDKLSTERKARLDAMGFDWNPYDTSWQEAFEHLQAFVKERKHCRVFRDYIAPDGFKLGQWVHGQRQSQDKLSAERKGRLDELGFVWDPSETDWA